MDTHALRPYFLLALIILSSIVAFAIFLPFLAPLLMAIVFAVVLSPLSHEDDEILFGRLERAINSVIKGNLSIALIQGIIAAVGFTIFGLPNSVIWGTLTAFAALIPGVGTSLVVIPAVIYLFFASGMFPAIGLLVWGVLAVGLIDNFLGPKLIGSGMRLHPLFVLFAVLGGISLFGAIGIFLGPLTLAFLVALVSVYLDRSPHELAAEGERAAG